MKNKKQIQEEEIVRLEHQIKAHQAIKDAKKEDYNKTIEKQDEEIEVLNVKLEAMRELKVT